MTMTSAVLITLFAVVVIVMTALRLSKRKEFATSHEENDDDIFRRAPRWAGRLNEKLNDLKQLIGREARADERRDTKMSAETQAAIDELKAEVAPMSDAVTAVAATVDKLLAMIEEAGDDPDEIRAVVANFRSERDRIIAAALKGTPIDPSTN